MADRSFTSAGASSSYGGSPISRIARDQLHTILLLLPAESVVAFAMTCKKFRAMASSDALWEPICLREWGPTSVGWFKSSRDHRVPWMRFFEMVSRLDSVSCHRLLSDADAFGGEMGCPDPRASHSLNFVSDFLVLFGGGCEGGRHLDDTWVAYVGKDSQGTVKWQKVNSGIPSGRFGHTCVVIDNFLVLFGGIDDHGNRLNDTWVGQLVHHKTLGTTLSWKLLDVGPAAPLHRGAHGACCIANRKMVIQGGIGLNGIRFGDTWVLELSENFCYGTWYEIVSHPTPPARSGHTLTCVGGSRTVLFGGRGVGYEVLDDIWLLDGYEDQLKWVQIPYKFQNIPGGVLLPRVGHSATRILDGRVLIYGGEDSSRLRKDDFWVLDLRAFLDVTARLGKLSSEQLLAKIWKGLKVKAYKPKSRSFHRACADQSGHRIYVFGGMVDDLLQPAEPFGLRFDGELFLVELVLQT